jgi:3D (Asp-Asp-Asp) domain-containing protein
MTVTAYCNGQACTGKSPGSRGYGITALGAIAEPGTIASDWAVLPPGTRIFVPGYGPGVISDRGGAIRGNRLDVWMPSYAAALRFGKRVLMVRIEGVE